MTRKILVPVDLDNLEKKVNDIIFPVKINNEIVLKGIKSGKIWNYGIVILTGQKSKNDIFKSIVDNGHRIESVEIQLNILNEYVTEMPKFKIGNILKLKTKELPLEFLVEHQRLTNKP